MALRMDPPRPEEGAPVKVFVGLTIDDMYYSPKTGASILEIVVTATGWLRVEWCNFNMRYSSNTAREKLGGQWRPDIRLLNSVSVAEPLLNDNTEVLCLPHGWVLVKVQVQFRVHPRGASTKNVRFRLGSYTSSTQEIALTPIAEVPDIGEYARYYFGNDSPQASVTTEQERMRAMSGDDVVYDRLIVSIVGR